MIFPVPLRVVFDTNVVLSTLLFRSGRLAWLRTHWQQAKAIPLVSQFTIAEIGRVLERPKFQLLPAYRAQLLALYLPYCRIIDAIEHCSLICRNPNDQPLLDLAQSGAAHVLVTGDQDLLSLAGQAAFAIETPEQYRVRFSPDPR